MSINGAQSERLKKGTIEFKKAFKQRLVPFKIYSDFERILTSAESQVLAQKDIKITFLVAWLTNIFLLMINLVEQLFFTKVKILLINLLKKFLKSMNTVKY